MIRRSPLEGVALIDGLHELPFLAQLDLRLDADDAEARRPSSPSSVRCRSNRIRCTAEPRRRCCGWVRTNGSSSAHPTAKPPSRPSFTSPRGPRGTRRHRRRLGEPDDARVPRPTLRELLEFGCPIDLHPRAFGPGRCAQTLLARANVLIWHVTDEPEDTWRLFVRPSFAAYVAAWLADAADGLID